MISGGKAVSAINHIATQTIYMKFVNKRISWVLAAAALLAPEFLAAPLVAAVPPPEQIVPDDTLILVTTPDFAHLRESYRKTLQSQFWADPAMKPFRDKFEAKWQEELVKPLERELGVKMEDYYGLLQGQVTFALIQNGWQGDDKSTPGWVIMLDTKDKSTQLKTNLAALRKRWADSGRAIKTEKIRDQEFSIVSLTTNDLPKTLQRFFSSTPSTPPPPADGEAKPASPPENKFELVIGQAESVLVLGNSVKCAEKVVGRIMGAGTPVLGDVAAFQSTQQMLFRDAPMYGWANTKTFVDVMLRSASEEKNPDPRDPLSSSSLPKIITAIGLNGLKSVGGSIRDSADGTTVEVFVAAPEASRKGLMKLLTGEPKETLPPPFIPADALTFQRWRIDGQKAWATLEATLAEISGQASRTLNWVIDTANESARTKDPEFDLRKNLIANLGDDVIHYTKPLRAGTPSETNVPPSLWLIGTAKPEQLLGALRPILTFLNPSAATPKEREFLGRKVYSVVLPGMPMSMFAGGRPPQASTLTYAAGNGYLALTTTDASILEEYLRSGETPPKALREAAGLSDAAAKVTGSGAYGLAYENQAETMRITFELLKQEAAEAAEEAKSTNSPASGPPPYKPDHFKIKDWMDFSLMPPFDKVSKYFYFSVYGVRSTTDGLSLKVFAPTPPELRK